MISQQKLIGLIVAIVVVLFGGLTFALFKMPPAHSLPAGEIIFNDEASPTKGKQDAKVVVRMYSDFQCPACRFAEPALQAIMQAYSDRVKFVWKDFPLLAIHPNARGAANVARCADAQGKFWEYHDQLFTVQDGWAKERDPKTRFAQFARELGLGEGDFTKCMNDRSFDDRVMRDLREGEKNGVNSTPTFFINDRITRARTEAEWRSALDATLKDAEKK